MSESTAGASETDDRTARLEEEGEIAADYLEELLDIADLDGDIDLDIRFGRAAVEVLSEDGGDELDRLVGRDGEVLDALQELTRLAVQVKTGERSRLMLDVAGFRAARRAELTKLGESAVAEVRATGQRVALEPLNAFERKVVHDVVAAAGLISDSEGEEPRRYVVIHPAGGASSTTDSADRSSGATDAPVVEATAEKAGVE
ncbi:protein jag [Myceligenerans pegani]|uniref:Single-stranded DNA-binding protein n=1 Tax=Myceligenerans pegani TaxID=2776917 RepID=A0ABR9N1I9_9MICO|nr:R3H domain-containing nucleic acid-binding protein [Myceligenerans sp. TRM 65318]MBE1877515.1 single-stranded DNA-binding protein [Myceligenerans sp. TRM 65318]MBE3019786.1 single-stranded DNA-binding protein [Myceligenerans sp. TRM 65318]